MYPTVSPQQLRVAQQQRAHPLVLLLHHGFQFGDPFGWRNAPILRLLCKSS
jgi:hypothetical protein